MYRSSEAGSETETETETETDAGTDADADAGLPPAINCDGIARGL
jgi:hypothetical protein